MMKDTTNSPIPMLKQTKFGKLVPMVLTVVLTVVLGYRTHRSTAKLIYSDVKTNQIRQVSAHGAHRGARIQNASSTKLIYSDVKTSQIRQVSAHGAHRGARIQNAFTAKLFLF